MAYKSQLPTAHKTTSGLFRSRLLLVINRLTESVRRRISRGLHAEELNLLARHRRNRDRHAAAETIRGTVPLPCPPLRSVSAEKLCFHTPRPSIRPSRLQRRHKATQQLRQGAGSIPPPNKPQIPKQVQKIPKQVRAISQAGTTRFPTRDKVSPREGMPAAPRRCLASSATLPSPPHPPTVKRTPVRQ